MVLARQTSYLTVNGAMVEDPNLFATKYMPYLPTESELIAEIERVRRNLNFFGEDERAEEV